MTTSALHEGVLSEEEKQELQCTIHVLPNTHWDREWRFPFQETRMHLMQLIERLLDIMEKDPEYKYFNFDSQTIFLDDYLELRPENRDRLARLIRERRLIVGPWYTLPEMNVIGGESIVRNLLMGRRVGDSFGYTSRAGYTPTSYGQVSQIAQIYKSFGIDGIIFYRGIHAVECGNEYILEAPDGSRIYGIRVSPNVGRGAFYLYVERASMHDDNWAGYAWDQGYLPFHLCRAETDHEEEPRLLQAPFTRTFNPNPIAKGVRNAMAEALHDATGSVFCLFDGMDSTGPNKYLPKIIEECNKVNPKWKFVLSSLPNFLEDMKAHVDERRLKVLRGERRRPSHDKAFNAFLKDSMSARMYLKIRNAEVERALMAWAEPFSIFARPLGCEYPESMLLHAWKQLLSNHSHDSIGGLSPDQIHKDMVGRFDQAFLTGEAAMKRSLGAIVSGINTADAAPEDVLITVFNPTPHERNEVVECYVDLPRRPGDAYRPFSIYGPDGEKVLQQELGREQSYLIATEQNWLPMTFHTWKWKVAFEARAIPPMGFATYIVKPVDAPKKTNYGTQCVAANTMENEFLRVAIQPNGVLTVTDKRTGEVYRNLNWFEDSGESGDPWWRWVPPADRVFNSLGSQAQIVKETDGPVLTTFSVSVTMNLPIGVTDSKLARRQETAPVTITSYVSLKKGVSRVEVKTVVNNTVRDHRLRMMAESGLRPGKSLAHCQFDVVERSTILEDTSEWLEPTTGTHPMNGFHGAANDERGIGVLSFGLTEYEVVDDEVGTVATTLLRAYQYPKMSGLLLEDRVKRAGNEGSQMPGEQTFRYAFCFFAGNWEDAGVLAQMAEFRNPVIPTHHGRFEGKQFGRQHSFLRLSPGQLMLSCVKKAEQSNDVVVRVYNPTGRKLEGRLWFGQRIVEAWRAELDERRVEKLEVKSNHEVHFHLGHKAIVTLELSV